MCIAEKEGELLYNVNNKCDERIYSILFNLCEYSIQREVETGPVR